MRLAGMTRVAAIAACLLAVSSAAARAQILDLDQTRLQVLQQQLEIAQVQALEAQRAVNAVQEQLRTEQTLRALEAGRQGAAAATLPYAGLPYSPGPYASLPNALALGSDTGGVVAPIAGQHATDSDRLLQLQGEAVARSNARILAIRPAL